MGSALAATGKENWEIGRFDHIIEFNLLSPVE
jgi:hypothetical protein